MDILFTVIAGPHQGKEFLFAGHDTFVVGRSKHAHFQLADKDKSTFAVEALVGCSTAAWRTDTCRLVCPALM